MLVLRGREGVVMLGIIALVVAIAILAVAWGGGGPAPIVSGGCSAYSTQAEAQAAFDAGVKGLDGDGDGIACESLR